MASCLALVDKEKKIAKRKEVLDKGSEGFFLLFAVLCSLSVFLIVGFILVRGVKPFLGGYYGGGKQDVLAFFTSYNWTYSGEGGMPFLLLTTIYVTGLSLLIAAPIAILGGLFIARVAPKKIRVIFQTALEILSSIPSVIYGLFGMAVICPLIRNLPGIGSQTSGGQSILAASLVLALMSIPTIGLLSYNAIFDVDPSLIYASLALGASKEETNYKVVLPSAESGIFAGIILGIGRALGEATAVSMVIGSSSNGLLFYNPLNPGNTLTSAMLGGMSEAVVDSLGYDVRFSLGLVLILLILVTTLSLNALKRRRERKRRGI